MNIKPLLYLSSFLAVTLMAPVVMAGPQHGGGSHIAPMAMRGGGARPFVGGRTGSLNGQHWNGQRFAGQHWNGQHWNGAHGSNWNWHHHHHDHNDVVFISSFGFFPFWGWWGYPYYYGYYPYGYYPYGYYGDYGYGYGNGYTSGYGIHARVAELQRRLARAGYYHGAIDGILGPRTRYALRAYRHDHGTGSYG